MTPNLIEFRRLWESGKSIALPTPEDELAFFK
jgi:hypothetical protein